jgi:hypothetical protein
MKQSSNNYVQKNIRHRQHSWKYCHCVNFGKKTKYLLLKEKGGLYKTIPKEKDGNNLKNLECVSQILLAGDSCDSISFFLRAWSTFCTRRKKKI